MLRLWPFLVVLRGSCSWSSSGCPRRLIPFRPSSSADPAAVAASEIRSESFSTQQQSHSFLLSDDISLSRSDPWSPVASAMDVSFDPLAPDNLEGQEGHASANEDLLRYAESDADLNARATELLDAALQETTTTAEEGGRNMPGASALRQAARGAGPPFLADQSIANFVTLMEYAYASRDGPCLAEAEKSLCRRGLFGGVAEAAAVEDEKESSTSTFSVLKEAVVGGGGIPRVSGGVPGMLL